MSRKFARLAVSLTVAGSLLAGVGVEAAHASTAPIRVTQYKSTTTTERFHGLFYVWTLRRTCSATYDAQGHKHISSCSAWGHGYWRYVPGV